METRRQGKLPRRTSRDHDVSLNKRNCKKNVNDEDEYVKNDVELTFDVVTIICKKLNARDLHNVARVCRCWNEAAENEKKLRSGAKPVKWSGYLRSSWSECRRFADGLRTRPMFGVMFTRPFDKLHPATSKSKADDCPCGMLPSRCVNVLVGNYGVVDDSHEMEDEPKKATWMLLPSEKGVTIETVCVPAIDSKTSTRRLERMARIRLQKMALPVNDVKCLIFLTSEDYLLEDSFLRIFPRNRERSVSGGLVANLMVCRNDEDGRRCRQAMRWIGITISGPTVRSWSVVLKRSCDTKDKVVSKLKLLHEQARLRKHSIGFMFACRGRGEYMLREKNVESTAFKQLFPEVPLIGGYGEGEYGDSTVEFCGDDEPVECDLGARVHQYSTVFMIVTYGPSIVDPV